MNSLLILGMLSCNPAYVFRDVNKKMLESR